MLIGVIYQCLWIIFKRRSLLRDLSDLQMLLNEGNLQPAASNWKALQALCGHYLVVRFPSKLPLDVQGIGRSVQLLQLLVAQIRTDFLDRLPLRLAQYK